MSFEPSKNDVVINKAYLDGNLSKLEGRLLFVRIEYVEFKKAYRKFF